MVALKQSEGVEGVGVSDGAEGLEFHPVEMIPLDRIVPNAWNPNEMDEKTFNRLVEEIKEIGFVEPIHLAPVEDVDGNRCYRILGGEHRFRAVKLLGGTEIPALVLRHSKFSDEKLQKALTVRLNVLHGRLNKGKMIKLFQEFAAEHSEEQVRDMFAFTDRDQWEKLVGDTKKNLKKAGLPPELLSDFEKHAKEAKTVDDLGKIVQRLFELYKDTVPYDFMVFTYGKREHVYVAMTSPTRKELDKVLKICKDQGVEINELLAPALRQIAKANGSS